MIWGIQRELGYVIITLGIYICSSRGIKMQ